METFPHKSATLSLPNGDLLLIGGIWSGVYVGSFYKFNWTTHALVKLPTMTTPRHSHTCIYASGCIFVFGGHTKNGITNKAEKYIVMWKEWV